MKSRPTRRALSAIAIISILSASLSIPTEVSADESEWPIGYEWLYQYRDSYLQENYEGDMRYFCVGKTLWESGSNSIEVIEYRSRTRGNISSDGPGFSLSGNFSIDSTEYYDIDTGAIVAYVFRQEMRVIETVDYHRSYWNYTEYNMTEYLPPGGLGFEPVQIAEGTVWHKNYSIHSRSNGTAGEVEFDVQSNYTEHVKYTFLGFETISVPAGSYHSSVLKGDYDDGSTSTVWYSDIVSNFVRMVDSYPGGDMLELSLVEYSRASGGRNDAYAVSPWNWLFFSFIGATAGAVIAAWVIVRRRRLRDETPPYQSNVLPPIPQDSHLKK